MSETARPTFLLLQEVLLRQDTKGANEVIKCDREEASPVI